jgi:hypothetical protein
MRALTFAAVAVFALVTLLSGAVCAQTPYIATYFDAAYSQETSPNPCPGIGVVDYMWVALANTNTFITGVEFKVAYPPQMIFLADLDTQPVTVGTTNAGFSMSWALPQNGFYKIPVCKVQFLWACDFCPAPNIPIVVVPNPFTGFLGYTDFPAYAPFNAVGLTALICQTIPANESTWGKVKSLYGE